MAAGDPGRSQQGRLRRVAAAAARLRKVEDRMRHGALVTVASLVGKVGVLTTLAAVTDVYHGPERTALLFTVTASVACTAIFDPQTTPLLLVRYAPVERIRRGDWIDTHVLEVLGALLGVLVTVVAVLVASRGSTVAGIALPMVVLLEAAMLEQIWRFRRVGWQVGRGYGRYAAVDLSIGVVRIASAAALVTVGTTAGWVILAVGSVAHGLWLLRPTLDPGPRAGLWATLKAAFPYGLTTTLSSCYSQVPSVLAGMIVGAQTGVVLGVAARISQPTELVALSIAALGTQRMAAHPQSAIHEFRWSLRMAVWTSLICAAGVGLVGPKLVAHLGAPGVAAELVVVLSALTLIPKFIDYQQNSFLVATGHIRRRLVAASIAAAATMGGVVAVSVVTKGSPAVAEVAVAATLLLGELTLLVVLARASRALRREDALTTGGDRSGLPERPGATELGGAPPPAMVPRFSPGGLPPSPSPRRT